MTKHTICQKKTDLLRWTETSGRLTTKMEIQRFVLNCLFQVAVIVMLFCYVALSVVKTLQSIARKICVNVQQELNVFREFREDRNSPVWDKGRLFESFMKGEDYIVCAQSKRKNSLFPPLVETWKGFSISAAPLTQERFLELNVFLGSQLSTYLKTRSEQESQDRTQLVSCEKDLRQQKTKDSAMGDLDRKKSLAVNGKKVHCEVKVTKITPLSEIMAVMSRVKNRKRTRWLKSSTFANKAIKRNYCDVDDSLGEKELRSRKEKRQRCQKGGLSQERIPDAVRKRRLKTNDKIQILTTQEISNHRRQRYGLFHPFLDIQRKGKLTKTRQEILKR